MKQFIQETLFPANLSANTKKKTKPREATTKIYNKPKPPQITKSNTTEATMHQEDKILQHKLNSKKLKKAGLIASY